MPRKKRAYGAGSVWKTDDPQRAHRPWIAQVFIGLDVKGKKRYRRSSHATQTKANEWCDQQLEKIRSGELTGTGEQRLADFLADWLIGQKGHLGPNTYVSYERKIRLHLTPALGHLSLNKLTPQHVQAFLRDLTAKGQAPSTVRYCRAVLRAALDQAVTWGTIARNAAALTRGPKVAPAEIVPLTRNDGEKLLVAIRGHPLEALYTVALALGVRQGEALGLRWSDVDFDRQEIRVTMNLQRVDGRFVLLQTKTRKSRRVIALPAFAVAALKERRLLQKEQQLRATHWDNAWSLVFTTSVGTPLNRHNVGRQWRGFLKVAGLPRARFYDLRHTCASLLAAQGLSMKEVSTLLGHSTIQLTADIYTHLFPEAKRATATAMEDLFGEKKAIPHQNQ